MRMTESSMSILEIVYQSSLAVRVSWETISLSVCSGTARRGLGRVIWFLHLSSLYSFKYDVRQVYVKLTIHSVCIPFVCKHWRGVHENSKTLFLTRSE